MSQDARRRLAILAVLMLWASAVGAADTSVPGRILLVKDGRRLKMVAKPPTGMAFTLPTAGGSSDPTLTGGRVSVVDEGDNTHVFYADLPAGNWKAIGNPPGTKGYKYRPPNPCSQPNPCVVLVKGKVIKVVAVDDQTLNPPLAGAAMARVEVGQTAYTGHFSAPVLNAAGTYKSTAAPACTPPPGCCGGKAFHSFTTGALAADCGQLVLTNGMTSGLACQTLRLGGGQDIFGPGTLGAGDRFITKITSCTGQTATLFGATAADTGSIRTCTVPGCLFGSPVALPYAPVPPYSACLVTSVNGMGGGSLDCATGAESYSLTLQAEIFLTGDLLGAVPGEQPCPLCSAGTCMGGPNNGLTCTAADGATTHDCPPPPGTSIGTVPISLALSSGTVSWTGTVATNDTGSTSSVQTRVFAGYCRDADGTLNFENPAHLCWQNGMAVGVPCSGIFESCEQRSEGAFGPNGTSVQTITAVGSPQGDLGCGAGSGTLVGVFAARPTFGSADAPFDLPGPGAITMSGAGVLCSTGNPCPVAINTTTTSVPTTTSTSSTTSTTAAGLCCNGDAFLGFTNYVGVGDCGDVVNSGGMLVMNAFCSGLYTGGGNGSIPLPFQYPDLGKSVFALTACTGQTATLGPTTSTETTSRRNCTSPGCLFGAPIPLPNAAATPTSVCIENVVSMGASGAADCGTGSVSVTMPLQMTLYLSGDIDGGSAGIQPCPRCVATTCIGGANNGMACLPGTSSLGSAYPTSQDCPPSPSLDIGTLPIAFALSTGTVSWTGTPATNDTGDTASVQSRVFAGYCRDANGTGNFKSPPQACWLSGLPVGAPCAEPYESCEQRSNGAFGPNGGANNTITVIGTPAASLLGGPSAATLVSLFGMAPTFNATADATLDLPGPAAVSLPGSVNLCTSASACP